MKAVIVFVVIVVALVGCVSGGKRVSKDIEYDQRYITRNRISGSQYKFTWIKFNDDNTWEGIFNWSLGCATGIRIDNGTWEVNTDTIVLFFAEKHPYIDSILKYELDYDCIIRKTGQYLNNIERLCLDE